MSHLHEDRSSQYLALTNPGGNSTSGSYPTFAAASVTAPPNQAAASGVVAAGDGVIPMGAPDGGIAPKRVILQPIGIGAGGAYGMQVYGWTPTLGNFAGTNSQALQRLWVPTLLATYAITLGTVTGVANTDLGVTTLFAQTITQSYGPTIVTSGPEVVPDEYVLSPASGVGMICKLVFGFRYLQIVFQLSTGTTSMNCLWRRF